MKCAWKELMSVLPPELRRETDRLGPENLQEIRCRLGKKVELVTAQGSQFLPQKAEEGTLRFILNAASQYSPWAQQTLAEGYLTAPGGHRVGTCGDCVIREGVMTGIRSLRSLCIRVAKDFPDISAGLWPARGSILIIGPPGSGKTTLLRDLICHIGQSEPVSVVDERGELFPLGAGFERADRLDILTGCSKPHGIFTALKTMGPRWIAVDEITAGADLEAILEAGSCGVRVAATAHAAGKQDLDQRSLYRPLLDRGIFETLVVLGRDKSWRKERLWT